MSVLEKVREDTTAAMKAGEKGRVGALRMIVNELQKAEKEGGGDELAVLRPREIVLPSGSTDAAALIDLLRPSTTVTAIEPWNFEMEAARQALVTQLRTQSLHGFGLEDHPAAISAAGALVQYLRDTQKADLAHIREISYRTGSDVVVAPMQYSQILWAVLYGALIFGETPTWSTGLGAAIIIGSRGSSNFRALAPGGMAT